MGEAPLGKKAFRKAYNREMKRQVEAEVFGSKALDGEVIPPKPKRNQFNKIELTPELKQEIIERTANGESLKQILNDERMPSRFTINREEKRDNEFGADMKTARQVAADIYVDEMMEIADDAAQDIKPDGTVNYELVARSKMRIDQRRWIAARFDPARYGDKVQTDITSNGETIEAKVISPMEAARQVAFALELAKRANTEGEKD